MWIRDLNASFRHQSCVSGGPCWGLHAAPRAHVVSGIRGWSSRLPAFAKQLNYQWWGLCGGFWKTCIWYYSTRLVNWNKTKICTHKKKKKKDVSRTSYPDTSGGLIDFVLPGQNLTLPLLWFSCSQLPEHQCGRGGRLHCPDGPFPRPKLHVSVRRGCSRAVRGVHALRGCHPGDRRHLPLQPGAEELLCHAQWGQGWPREIFHHQKQVPDHLGLSVGPNEVWGEEENACLLPAWQSCEQACCLWKIISYDLWWPYIFQPREITPDIWAKAFIQNSWAG